MAAAAHPAAPVTPSPHSTSRRPLPHGACNFRDLSLGPKAPSCGCRRFWCDGSRISSASQGDGTREVDEYTPWCICAHHACYHEFNERQAAANAKGNRQSSAPLAPRHTILHTQEPIYVQLVPAKSGEHARLVVGSRQVVLGHDENEVAIGSNDTSAGQEQRQGDGRDVTSSPVQHTIGRSQHRTEELLSTTEPFNARPVTPPAYSTSSVLPPVPSVCLLNSHDLRPISPEPPHEDKQPHTRDQPSAAPSFICGASGLGFALQSGRIGDNNIHWSLSPTIADEQTGHTVKFLDKSAPPSTMQNSADHRVSPSRAFMQHILNGRSKGPPLNATYAPNAVALEDVIQSATEVATPSVRDTPDLRGLDQTLQDTKALVDALSQDLAAAELDRRDCAGDDLSGVSHRPEAAHNHHSPALLSNSQHGSYHAALRLVPSTLQQLVSHLRWVHDHLAMEPNVSTSILNLGNRLEALENASFNHVPADELHHQFELIDGRLLDVETRMDDHDKLQAAVDADQSSRETTLRKRALAVNASTSFVSNASFRSTGSLNSATSSALIAAAIDRVEAEARLRDVEQRLEDLETTAPPSHAQPWEVEVVLLPWGRDLKGIWFPHDEPPRAGSRGTTQNSDDWTQAHIAKSSNTTSATPRTVRDGWSAQAIHDWVNVADEWLWPKACGINSIILKRLQSRGLVRQITLRNSSAREIWAAIATAFGGLLETMCVAAGDSDDAYTPSINADYAPFLGLATPLIPLRKVHKSSRLLFLNPSEMVTPAIWTADFLASTVMMRAAGGQKRLFLAQREAYLQRLGSEHRGWTWQRLRELPRVHLNEGSAEKAEFVAEADAREACWACHPALDPPASANPSFSSDGSINSMHSTQDRKSTPSSKRLSLRPEPRPSSQPQASQPARPIPPISPLSELHPEQRPQRRRNRTLSTPLTESSAVAASMAPQPKRRVASLEHAKLAPKRRRTTLSPDFDAPSSSVRGNWGLTPRRSKEPPSPFLMPSSQRSQGVSPASAAVASGPPGVGGAYATPYSGMAVGGRHLVVDWRDGDTEVDEASGVEEQGDEEVWEGVGDEMDEAGCGDEGEDDAVAGAEGFDDDEEGMDEDEGSGGSYSRDDMDGNND